MRATQHQHRTFRISITVIAFALVTAAIANDTKADSKKKIKEPSLYAIGYSHLDTQWCWSYPQVIREFLPNTLHENFALFEKYPDYVFNWTGSNRYRMMKQYYPEDYAKLKQYVAAGKWFPAGSSVEEGDVNSPSEESLIRQVMYGNQFFRKEFGKASTEYMLPDCFGFPASLPSILAHCGLSGFSTQKLTWGSAVGVPFNVGKWVGPDGQWMVSALNPGAYDQDIEEELSHSQSWIDRLARDKVKDGVAVDYMYYGVGDRGGAPHEPSVSLLEQSIHGGGPLNVIGGNADKMFNDLTAADKEKLPTYKGDLELTQHSAGSLTSEAAMKRWNRKNELLANAAESSSVAANWLGAAPYDQARLTDAWLRFLPGQFHDLMAGTALPIAYTYTWNDEVIAMNEFAGVLQTSVGGVARSLDTRAVGVPIVVYNPLSINREDPVEATVRVAGKSIKVIGPDGVEVPSQFTTLPDGRLNVLFLAKVSSLGYATYDIQPASSQAKAVELKVSSNSLENARYRVTVDANGDVASVVDKKSNRELLSAPARLAYQFENPTQFPAWNMDWNDQRKDPIGYVDGKPQFKVVENGPVRVALQVTRFSKGSKFVQTIRLAAGHAGNRVEFATKIDWQGKDCALKAVFPLTVFNPLATYNWELGTIQRPNNNPRKYEVPAHKWFDLTDTSGSYGVSVLDDCKYGSDKPSDNTVRLTLLYTPGTRGGYQHQGTQDWGKNEMIYALEGHQGDWKQGQTQWEAARLNQPIIAFETPKHPGKLGRTFSLGQTNTPQVSIEALKKAEGSSETIVRTNELSGTDANDVHIKFAAPIVSAREVDGQERPIGPAIVKNGELVFSTTSYRPHAFAVTLAPSKVKSSTPISHPLALPYNLDAVSSWAKKTDGNFDGTGRTLPGELLPSTIDSDGVTFKLGPTTDGGKNALVANGQTIPLPPGINRKVYVLAAAAGGDTSGTFTVGKAEHPTTVSSWDGYVGQWDTRIWKGKVPELTYGWDNALDGLVPGYIKRDQIAWYADHLRTAKGENDPYAFCYLFRYGFPVANDAKTLTLPYNQKIRVFAVTVASNDNDETRPAAPLYDTLNHDQNTGPTISPQGGHFNDTTWVTVGHPFYWSPDWKLRYTTDGSKPTPASPVYTGPIPLNHSATVTAVEFDSRGQAGVFTSASIEVNDTTPPSIVSATSLRMSRRLTLKFSEPVDRASALNKSHYSVSPTATVVSAKLESDDQTVTLQLDSALSESESSVTVAGVTDQSPAKNPLTQGTFPVNVFGPAYSLNDVQTLDGTKQGFSSPRLTGLPTKGSAPWTINLFAYLDQTPNELTMLAGFGDAGENQGAERFLVEFENGIHFWGSNVDVNTGEPFDLHKWQMITLAYDGQQLTIYKNGRELKSAPVTLADAVPTVKIGALGPWGNQNFFNGKIADLTIWGAALPQDYIKTLLSTGPK